MEEETQSVGIESGHEGGDEFYEKIEAPKFVDFTDSDPHRPDDRYWFCMRVGCDQKHEEELDSETIYRNFVLRVMAARSPNVKLRKALARKAPSLKCPLTAPAKSSKPRVSRLALIPSFSHKMADAENRARKPLHKICATPNVKAKQPTAVSKALTTPRNRKPISNSETFRSVRNPKLKNIVVPENSRPVAKALVFHSPKKPVTTKASMERSSPVGKICSAMKKLEITSGKKHVLGYNKLLPLDTSRKQFRGREVKSRVFDSLRSNNCKGQEAKTLKRENMEKDLRQHCDPAPREEVDDNDSSDMEVDKKSREGALEGFSMSATSQSGRLNGENQVEILSETLNGDTTSLSGSEERDSNENYNKENANNGNGYEEKTKLRSEKRSTLEQFDDDDDKENNTASDENRGLNINDHSTRINLGKHDASKNSQKVNQADKIPKESSTSAASNAQGVKYRKPKSTNPKPFRFRTNERGMLKEATSEKKVHAPLKEITLVGTPGAKSTSKHQNVIQITKNCLGQSEHENDTQGRCEKRLDRRTRLKENGMKGATCLKTPKVDFERKASVVTPLRRKVSTYEKASPEREHKSKERTKSPKVQQRSVTRRGVDSSRKKAVVSSRTPCQLSVIKETSSRKIRPKKAVAPCSASPATKGSASSPSRSLSRGRRPTTVPKKPYFHNIHVPKTCAGLHKENDSLDEQ
ncbi:hypothetical protein D8674_004738 [Pyrus ussuriensis x Pyrus communis]|uniref:Uncharacterized protein n=1 Tax=Pyrus ussuriensis x Pyrus communis TaxID=2448454 RepID=A0A5N5FL89_9ROSA|nr:hypothetical protein D8674_004738 [Pyrus ussuriensis x Pyrus communis]